MNQVKVSGKVVEFKGKPVVPVIEFSAMADQFASQAEIVAAGRWPNESAIVKWVNAVSKNNARQKEYAKVTADLQTAYEKSPEFKRKSLIDGAKIGELPIAILAGILKTKGYDAMNDAEVKAYETVEVEEEAPATE